MSRWFVSRVAAVLVLAVLVVAFAACPTRAAGIDLKVDGQSIDALFPPILHRGVVMVPLDDLCAQVNTPCARDGERLFTRSAKGEVVEIVKSANRAWIGQTEHRLSVAPVFLTDTVLVPSAGSSPSTGKTRRRTAPPARPRAPGRPLFRTRPRGPSEHSRPRSPPRTSACNCRSDPGSRFGVSCG
jgi:hypothetical protein